MAKKSRMTAETPFTKSMLPHTRRELFFDVVKLHYVELLCLGLVMFVFALPLIANVMVTDFYSAQLSNAYADNESKMLLGQIVVAENTSALVTIPLMALLFVGVGGLLRVIRQYAWGEVVFPYRDFTLGIRQNAMQSALLGAISGVVLAVCTYLQNIADWNNNITAHYAASAAGAVSLLFLLPVGGYVLICISVYGNSFGQNFLQGLVLYLKEPVRAILVAVLCCAVFLMRLIPDVTVRFFAMVLGILTSPLLLLVWVLFAFGRLDRYINREKHPEIVNRGLYTDA